MLLNDIDKPSISTLGVINKYLSANYGIKLSENIDYNVVESLVDTINEEIQDLKINGEQAISSPEISKRLLILEGIKSLYSAGAIRSPELDKVVDNLAQYVVDVFSLSGIDNQGFEDAVKQAMNEYRSSKYRFPDEYVEQRVRDAAMSKIYDGINIAQSIDEDPWSHVSNRGYIPTHDLDHRTAELYGANDLEILPTEKDKIPMVRDKTGKLVPDPWAVQALQRKKGILYKESAETENKTPKDVIMKENLVKNLRRLLETEVSQAEVMMAAKGFAQELQEMIEKIGRLQNEDLPPVTDQMRETYGTESSSAFQTQIYGALQSVMDALYTAKGQVDDAVTNMATTGSFTASNDMEKPVDDIGGADLDDGMSTDLPSDLDNIEQDLSDDFGAAEFEDPLGREKKNESIILKKKILEMKKLVKKARAIRESAQK